MRPLSKLTLPFAELLRQRFAEAAPLVERNTSSIYASDSQGQQAFEGSGLLLEVSNRWFLVSAAHVFRTCGQSLRLIADTGVGIFPDHNPVYASDVLPPSVTETQF